MKFHPLSAALCDPTDSQQKCDVKQTAVIDCRLKPVQRELNVSPPCQGHGPCTKYMRSGSHCCMMHMALMCACLFHSGCGHVYKVINNFSEETNSDSTDWTNYSVDFCNNV